MKHFSTLLIGLLFLTSTAIYSMNNSTNSTSTQTTHDKEKQAQEREAERTLLKNKVIETFAENGVELSQEEADNIVTMLNAMNA